MGSYILLNPQSPIFASDDSGLCLLYEPFPCHSPARPRQVWTFGSGQTRSLSYHYHVLVLDGVVSGDVERGVQFHKATSLEARDAEALAHTVQLRVLRWFTRRGLMDRSAAADMRTWRGTGGCFASSMLSVSDASIDGFVRIEGEDRAGLERLVCYCARGPLALERLYAPAGIRALSSTEVRLVYRLPEPDVLGRQELRLTLLELLERLAPLVPPGRSDELRVILSVTLPTTVERILLHLLLPRRSPRLTPAQGPPQAELDLDQSPPFDLAAPERIPEYEFDQSPLHEWDA